MAIRLLPNGTIEFDTIEEAKAYVTEQSPSKRSHTKEDTKGTENDFPSWKYFKGTKNTSAKITDKGKLLLSTLSRNEWLNIESISSKSGLTTTQIAPVIKNIFHLAKKKGIKPPQVIEKRKVGKVSIFRLGSDYDKLLKLTD